MFSVVYEGKVYDVVCRNKSGDSVTQYGIYLRSFYDDKDVFLGYALKDTGGVTTNWWAFDGNKVNFVKGFATRRYAIEYMLYEHGYWSHR